MGAIYYPDGRTEERAPRNGHDWQLDELHDIVGGWLEMIPLHDGSGRILVLNEDGKGQGLPVNQRASDLAQLPTPRERYEAVAAMRKAGLHAVVLGNMEEADVIVGTVLVAENGEIE